MTNKSKHLRFSGIYPHLAVTNEGSTECGIGAIAAWAGKLWFITYPASGYKGDDNKLYSIDPDLNMEVSEKSVGGTHANRFIHDKSGQLIMGVYFIDSKGNVRALDPKLVNGRMTGIGKHLFNPDEKIYLNTMEAGLYEVDVYTLEWRRLRRDMFHELNKEIPLSVLEDKLPGNHGKGGYTGQGRYIVTNNGYTGVLAEWDGKKDPQKVANWVIVDREKYTEVTGPGGIHGPRNDDDPVWALGWDDKSVLLNVRYNGEWKRFRLPKASYTQDADHGWFTEWPRIREVGDFGFLMCMHGMLYKFPKNFTPYNSSGIIPISRHQKMIVDYEFWNGEIVFACDDASMFDNPMLGRQQSNLWFASPKDLENLGRPAGWGGVWLKETIEAGSVSEPFLISGFERKVLHISHQRASTINFKIEADINGTGLWEQIDTVDVPGHGYNYYIFPDNFQAQWVRLRVLQDIPRCTAYFHYTPKYHHPKNVELTKGIAGASQEINSENYSGGIVRISESKDLILQFVTEDGYYEIGGDMILKKVDNPAEEKRVKEIAKISVDFEVDDASVLIVDRYGNKFRLPRGADYYDKLEGKYRGIREVVTERSLLNAHGTIYELPRFECKEFMRIKPITTHNMLISDFASWRGMLVISGINLKEAKENEHCIISDDGKAALWFGNVDDLWQFGPPSGIGGPCKNTKMKAGVPSDPYLMACYINKSVELSHDLDEEVEFTIEVDFTADGTWHTYRKIIVPPRQKVTHIFPDGYSAHWVRIRVNKDCSATALFTYR